MYVLTKSYSVVIPLYSIELLDIKIYKMSYYKNRHVPTKLLNFRWKSIHKMAVKECMKITRLILLDICLNLTNLILTFANIHLFYETGYTKFGNISIFLLWFPGKLQIDQESLVKSCNPPVPYLKFLHLYFSLSY